MSGIGSGLSHVWHDSVCKEHTKRKLVILRHDGVWGSGGTGLLVSNTGASWRCVVHIKPWPLYPWYPVNSRLDDPSRLTGLFGEKKPGF
jgi:hypothetical protein